MRAAEGGARTDPSVRSIHAFLPRHARMTNTARVAPGSSSILFFRIQIPAAGAGDTGRWRPALLWLACLGLALAASHASRAEGIVVLAEPAPQTGEVDGESHSGFFSIISREQFDDQYNLAEVIERETAVQVRQGGGLGSFASLSLRGSSSEQVLIYIDGLLLNSGASASVNLGSIPLGEVERIEIYRGAAPAVFGRASLGGVVHIRRLRQQGRHASLALGLGTFGSRSLQARASAAQGPWQLELSTSLLQADNDFPFLYDNQTPFNPDDDSYQRRNNDDLRQRNLLLRGGYRPDADTRLELAYQDFDKRKGLPAWNNAAGARTRFDTREQRLQWQLLRDRLAAGRLNSRLRLDLANKRETYDDRLGQVGLGTQYYEYNTRTQALDYYLESVGERHLPSVTLNLQRESYRPLDLLAGREINRSQRHTLALALADQWLVWDERLQLNPVLRGYWVDDRRRSALPTFLEPEPPLERRDHYFAPQLGLRLELGSAAVLKSNLGRYYREPSFFELFGDQGLFLGNGTLLPESGVNFDLGLEFSRHWQHGPLRGLEASLAYFDSRMRQLITRTFDARGIGKAVNISSARIRGLETRVKLRLPAGIRLSANLTMQQPRNTSRTIPAFYGKRLPGRYVLASLARLDAGTTRLRAHLEWRFEGGQYYDSANLLPAPDKHEINAGLIYRQNGNHWSLEARNLGNHRYQDFRGYPQPGRAFYARLRHDF